MVVAMASFLFVGCLPTPTPTNVGPVFTSTPGTTATVGTAYSYTPTATDADGDTVTFAVAGPTGMAISGGVITWTPTTAQIGTENIIVTASDGTNATAQEFTITVSAAVVTGAIIDIAAIPGVTAPVYGATPDLTVTETAQYTGVTTWAPTVVDTFLPATAYTATITLTAKAGYTLTGVAANFFTVAGATSDTNPANSGVVTAVFPATAVGGAVFSIPGITGVDAPVTGAVPDLAINTSAQYTGTIAWKTLAGVAVGTTFVAGTTYVATITLLPAAGYTLTGVVANSFTLTGLLAGSTATNPVNSGVVTAIYPATFSTPTVLSANFVDSDTVTIVFSEAVTITGAASSVFTPLSVTFPLARTLAATNIYGSTTTTISVDFTGYECNGLTRGSVTIVAGTITASAAGSGLTVAGVTKVIAAGNF